MMASETVLGYGTVRAGWMAQRKHLVPKREGLIASLMAYRKMMGLPRECWKLPLLAHRSWMTHN